MGKKINLRRNDKVKNNTVSETVKNQTEKSVSNATSNNIVETAEMIVDNGTYYGSPNIKQIKILSVFENGDYVTEELFYINGYKFRMDDMMKYSMKQFLSNIIPKYKGKEDIDKLLTQSVSYKAPNDSPQYIKCRMKQLTTLVRGLIKALKDSPNINDELTAIFGTTKYDKIFLKEDFNGQLAYNWKAEYKKDYSGNPYRL